MEFTIEQKLGSKLAVEADQKKKLAVEVFQYFSLWRFLFPFVRLSHPCMLIVDDFICAYSYGWDPLPLTGPMPNIFVGLFCSMCRRAAARAC